MSSVGAFNEELVISLVSLALNNTVSGVPSTPQRSQSLPAVCPGAPSRPAPAKRVSSNGTSSNNTVRKELFLNLHL